jgi:O-antigen/teichoic acid export membrane protein
MSRVETPQEGTVRRSTHSHARVATSVRDPLIRNGHALNLSTVVSSLIGLLFWVFAARRYPAGVVGRNSVAIAALMFIGGVAQLNLTSALTRYLPRAGAKSRRMVFGAYALSAAVAIFMSTVFLVLVPRVLPELRFLVDQWWLAIWFACSTVLWAIFVLEDGALTGLRRTPWIPVENGAFATLKAAFVGPMARLSMGAGILLAWTGAVLLTVIPTNRFLFKRVIPANVGRGPDEPPTIHRVYRYATYDFLGSLFWLGATSLLPLLVIAATGARKSAFFSLAWVIAFSLYLVSINLGSSLVVETAHDPSTLRQQCRRIRLHLLRILVPVVTLVVVLAPLLLSFFGRTYAAEGTTTLRLLALSALPAIVPLTAVSACRSLERTRPGCVINAALFVTVSTISWVLLPKIGIVGVGVAWLVAQLGLATVIIATERWWLFRTASRLRTASGAAQLAYWAVRKTSPLPIPHLPECLRRPRMRSQARQALRAVPLHLAVASDASIADVAKIKVKVKPSLSDRTVALLSDGERRLLGVVKIPRSPEAAAELRTEEAVIRGLRDEPRIGPFVRLLPSLRVETVSGSPVSYETAFDGFDAAKIIDVDASLAGAVECAALGAIDGLHRRTASVAGIEPATFERWTAMPLELLSRTHPSGQVSARQTRSVERLEARLSSALVGRHLQLGWVHGDFTPGNVMMDDQDMRVQGILDWSQARPDGVAALDALLWMCSIDCQLARTHFGALVSDVLKGTASRWPMVRFRSRAGDGERPGLAAIARTGVPLTELLLWCWLTHVAGNIAKSRSYGRNPLWWVRNVDPVLRVIES